MRRGFGVSLGTMGNGLGQEKGKQPGFTWILALRHLCGQPLSRKPTVREWPLLPPPPLLLVPYHAVRVRHPAGPQQADPRASG